MRLSLILILTLLLFSCATTKNNIISQKTETGTQKESLIEKPSINSLNENKIELSGSAIENELEKEIIFPQEEISETELPEITYNNKIDKDPTEPYFMQKPKLDKSKKSIKKNTRKNIIKIGEDTEIIAEIKKVLPQLKTVVILDEDKNKKNENLNLKGTATLNNKETDSKNNNEANLNDVARLYPENITGKIETGHLTKEDIDRIAMEDEYLKAQKTMKVKDEIYNKNFDLTNYEAMIIDKNSSKETEANENDEITVSLEKPDWIIKALEPDLIKLKKRENLPGNTAFLFTTQGTGVVNIIFSRYDGTLNKIIEQDYKITVKPRNLFEDKAQTAKKQPQKQTKIEKKKPDVKKILADELFAQKKFNEAKTRYNALIQEGKIEPDIYYKLGIIEKEASNDTGALDFFQKNIKEKDNPNFSEALIEIIKLMKKQKKYNEAVDTFYTYGGSENITPELKETLYINLADVYFSMNDFVSSANEYRRFISNYPGSKDIDKAMFYLAYSVENLQNNPDFKEAYRLYKIIQSNFPESKFYQLSKNRMLLLERHYLKVN